jgi:GNAT superfamily N-acetyltransferase
MIHFEVSTEEKLHIEKEIINSNPEFNFISHGKTEFSDDDILQEYLNCQKSGAERYLIKSEDEYFGIIEFLMSNPHDRKPWLGLLVIHHELQGKGYGRKAIQIFEAMLKARGAAEVRLLVVADYKEAVSFWGKIGFVKYAEQIHKGKETFCYEKKLS